MKSIAIDSLEELSGVASRLLEKLETTENSSVVFALHGELGAGKTTFVQLLAKALGVKETVTSPTFVVMKSYDTNHSSFTQLIHIDAYRIEDVDEMRVLHFSSILGEADTIVCIEWAEKIAAILPSETVDLFFTYENDKRVIQTDYEF